MNKNLDYLKTIRELKAKIVEIEQNEERLRLFLHEIIEVFYKMNKKSQIQLINEQVLSLLGARLRTQEIKVDWFEHHSANFLYLENEKGEEIMRVDFEGKTTLNLTKEVKND